MLDHVPARLRVIRICRPRYGCRAGSDGGAATVCSLIATAKLNDVEPFAYLTDVLERLSSGYPASRIDELLPWNWRPSATLN